MSFTAGRSFVQRPSLFGKQRGPVQAVFAMRPCSLRGYTIIPILTFFLASFVLYSRMHGISVTSSAEMRTASLQKNAPDPVLDSRRPVDIHERTPERLRHPTGSPSLLNVAGEEGARSNSKVEQADARQLGRHHGIGGRHDLGWKELAGSDGHRAQGETFRELWRKRREELGRRLPQGASSGQTSAETFRKASAVGVTEADGAAAASESTLGDHRGMAERQRQVQGQSKSSGSSSDQGRETEVAERRASDTAHQRRSREDELLWQTRQQEVAAAFRHAWEGYRLYAFGRDELRPGSQDGEDGLGGLGATIVDALDTAMIMGHADIVKTAGDWVASELPKKIAAAGQVNLFETTIRVLGGLLAAYHLRSSSLNQSGPAQGRGLYPAVPAVGPMPEAYLAVARDLGERLVTAFDMSPTAVPLSDVILSQKRAQRAGGNGMSSTAECTTLQAEFWELSRLTGEPHFGRAAMKVMEHFRDLPKEDGLVPIYIDPNSGGFQGASEIRLGSRGDSYYEYLVKVWLQQGRSPAFLRRMFDEAMAGVKKWLVAESKPRGLTFIAERPSGIHGPLHPKMDHLVCFLPGALLLGATGGLTVHRAARVGLLTPTAQYYVDLARNMTKTCWEMYAVTATGLAPEIAYFNTNGLEHREGTTPGSEFGADIEIHHLDRHNLLRPEAVEALFYMHRTTGEPQYREWGWDMFRAFQKHTKVASGGYTSLNDVTVIPPPLRNKMETFFLGETLKYFYLLFGDDSVLPLNKFIFNTEAHPLPIIPALASPSGDSEGRSES